MSDDTNPTRVARRFSLATYMSVGDAFHVARKPLSRAGDAPFHCHDYYELFLVEVGVCRHQLAGQEEILEAGAMGFVRPEDTHSLSAPAGESCRIVNVMFRPQTADHLVSRYSEDLSERYFWAHGAHPVVLTLGPDRVAEIGALASALQTGPRSLARIESFLLAVMTDLADVPSRVAPAMPPWLAQACDAARRPEVYRRGASGLVEAAGRGHEHVCRQMKRHLGLTPSAYVNRIRMERAGVLIVAGDLSLAEVAADVGLENLSHFHRLFRAHHGLTPRMWYARHRATPF